MPSFGHSLLLGAVLLANLYKYALAQDGLQRLANGFIVEYANIPDLHSRDVVQDVVSKVSHATGVQVAHKMDLRSSIFNGASFSITGGQVTGRAGNVVAVTDNSLETTLMQMHHVVAVYPNYVRYLQTPLSHMVNIPRGVFPEGSPEIGHARQDSLLPNSAQANIQQRNKMRRQYGSNSSQPYGPDLGSVINPHAMTGVDRLQSEGILGQGIKIAIIDAGIDPYNPALGSGYGPGFKVEGGYDFVGDQPDNNVDPPAPDDSPYTVCSNHGTATSSIAAGLPYKFGFVGVAPNATLLHYKVFPCDGGVTTDVGVNASLTAYEAGVDVINASIGGQGGWGNDLWSLIASRIMENGIVYTIPAGNDGDLGFFIDNSLSSAKGVPSIGSVDNAYTTTLLAIGSYRINNGTPIPIHYAPGFPANWTSPLEIINLRVDGCTPYPNVTFAPNQVILLPRPYAGTTDCDQLARAQDAGIRNLLLYNSFDDLPTRPLPVPITEGFPFDWLDGIGYVDRAVGLQLADYVANGSTVTLDLPWRPEYDTRIPRVMQNTISGGFMSNYSSWGPTYEAKLGTTFSAPGGFYMAAGATIYGGLVIASGTSFSAPYTAGVAALMKQANPNLTPNEIINRLATTAKPMMMQSNLRVTQDYLDPVFRQGGGLIDAWAAVHTTTTLNVSDLAFNDTAYLQMQAFEIRNDGLEPVAYEITHVPGPTVYTFAPGNNTVTAFNDTLFDSNIVPDMHAELDFSSSSMTIEAGGIAAIAVKATPPFGLDMQRVPLYSGFISIMGSNNDTLSLPYGGIAAALRDVAVLDTTPGQERTYLCANTTNGDVVRPGLDGNNMTSTFTIPLLTGNVTSSSIFTNISLPGYSMTPVFGSLMLNVSLLQDGVDLGSIRRLLTSDDVPPHYVRDSAATALFYGQMADGTFVGSGTYRFRLRLLRVTGDPEVDEDWDEVVTEPFTLYLTGGTNAAFPGLLSRTRGRYPR